MIVGALLIAGWIALSIQRSNVAEKQRELRRHLRDMHQDAVFYKQKLDLENGLTPEPEPRKVIIVDKDGE